MKYLKYSLIGLLSIAGIGFIILAFYDGPKIALDTGGHFDFENLQEIKLHQYEKQRTFVPLPDGAKLAMNYYLPKGEKDASYPVVLLYTPYNRSFCLVGLKWWEKIALKWMTGSWDPVYDMPGRKLINTFTAHGYAVAVTDIRGTGASSGNVISLSPQIGKDGAELVKWISKQSWCDGNIGMQGPSYLGWSQMVTASNQPPELKCISPGLMGFDIYTEAQRMGGILAEKWVTEFNEQLRLINLNALERDRSFPVFPCEPVIDEDGDGEYIDEIPKHCKEHPCLFVHDKNPKYRDHGKRKDHIYFHCTKEHLKDVWPASVANDWIYRDHQAIHNGDTINCSHVNPGFFVPAIQESKIPILMIAGWFDGFQGVPKLFANYQESNPAKLFVAPRFHMPFTLQPAIKKWLDYKGDYEDQLISLRLRYFEHYLKGIDNGFDKMDAVQVYTLFKGWESFEQWPPKNAHYQNFYLNEQNSLSANVSETGIDDYQIDFSHQSSYDKEGDNRFIMTSVTDEVMVRTELDKKCLIYETAALPEAMQITGHPIIELFLSCDRPDADIYVYLSDVDEKGEAFYVAETQLRAGWHELKDKNDAVNNLYEVQPDLPWHGFEEGKYKDAPFAAEKTISLRLDLSPTSWLFRKGHKIRIAIAGADFENFELNPTLCPENTLESCQATQLSVHRGEEFLSRIELPVLRMEKQAMLE